MFSVNRFNDYCEKNIAEIPSKKGVKKAIQRGELLLNDLKVEGGRHLSEGDIITLVDLNLKPAKIYNLNLEVCYEDDFIAVVNKPAGLCVSGNQFKTIQNALLFNLIKSNHSDALNTPLTVHRLDKQTSGLLIVAKTRLARINLGLAFEKKEVKKKYVAILMGELRESMLINEPIEGKESISILEPMRIVPSLQSKWLSLVSLIPETGRTHQLRVHSQLIGCPILGDQIYGFKGNVLKHKGLFLASVGLSFMHPITNAQLKIEIPIPKKFINRLDKEHQRYLKFNKE